MRILLDEDLPRRLCALLVGARRHNSAAQWLGGSGHISSPVSHLNVEAAGSPRTSGRIMSAVASRLMAVTALFMALWPAVGFGAWELSGTKSIVVTTAEGTRIQLGSIQFTPAADGTSTFKLTLEVAPFSDHFLSMREFKCLQGRTELTCHVPYPYPNPGTVRPGDLAWLEHSLLFFYKRPSDFGAKLWNGIYFELQETDVGLVGKPRAVDLNLIAAPPANASTPPFRSALRDDMPSNARWIRSLSIE